MTLDDDYRVNRADGAHDPAGLVAPLDHRDVHRHRSRKRYRRRVLVAEELKGQDVDADEPAPKTDAHEIDHLA